MYKVLKRIKISSSIKLDKGQYFDLDVDSSSLSFKLLIYDSKFKSVKIRLLTDEQHGKLMLDYANAWVQQVK